MKVELHEQESPRQCPYCHGGLGAEHTRACGTCGTAYHAECALELRTCAVLGCGRALGDEPSRSCRKCRDRIPPGHDSWACTGCSAIYHLGCAHVAGRCIDPWCATFFPSPTPAPGAVELDVARLLATAAVVGGAVLSLLWAREVGCIMPTLFATTGVVRILWATRSSPRARA